jgi:hypothetical protein
MIVLDQVHVHSYALPTTLVIAAWVTQGGWKFQESKLVDLLRFSYVTVVDPNPNHNPNVETTSSVATSVRCLQYIVYNTLCILHCLQYIIWCSQYVL